MSPIAFYNINENYIMTQENQSKSSKSRNSCDCSSDSSDFLCPRLKESSNPECDLKFRIATTVSDTQNNNGSLIYGTIKNQLQLCNNIVVFNGIKCNDNNSLNYVLLGIPLVYVDRCYKYTIDTSNLSIPTPSSSTIVVTDFITGTPITVNLQVANGYLYIIIGNSGVGEQVGIDKYITFDETTCKAKLALSFDQFAFDLKPKRMNCCDYECLPVVWSFGYYEGVLD